MWCESAEHDREACEELEEALRWDRIYYKGGRIHSIDSQRPLRTDFQKEGIKKVLEEETTTRSNYASIARIRVGETSGTKISF